MRINSAFGRIAWGAQGLAATAALATLAAPPASAAVWELWVGDKGSTPELRVGTAYQLSGHTSADITTTWVSYYDNDKCVGSASVQATGDPDQQPTSHVTWVPTSAGTHTLRMKYQGDTLTLTVQVLPALPGGPNVTQPDQRGCGAVGSFDLGSLSSGS
ncbi:hypothetical protein [Nocardia yamanashiensis]|uniref:hypothetical protein n=1 Tax=Nocardia yamanashiensis TaxID=209247 RepID=UPI00082C5BE6|nr:hypothetical protein [Nocardia yamanashiensis]